MFTVHVLPAGYGDSLWIEYGDEDAPRVILIDAGPTLPEALTNRLTALQQRGGELELVVVTHVDADHIAGMLTLLKENFYGVPVRDIWFNGYRHLPADSVELMGPVQGEKLTALILDRQMPWNVAFGQGPIMLSEDGSIVEVQLGGGARITLLSPDRAQLARLRKEWVAVCANADLFEDMLRQAEEVLVETLGGGLPDIDKLSAAVFKEDRAEANGSSIAFVLEFEGKRVLCGADAYPSIVDKALAATGNAPHRFDLVKLPHHGSDNNVSEAMIQALACPVYVFSSDGAKFKHPAPEAVARVIKHGKNPTVAFNYRTKYNEIWDQDLLTTQYPFTTEFGDEAGLSFKLA